MKQLERALRLRALEFANEHETNETNGVTIIKTRNSISYTFKNNKAGEIAYKMFTELCRPVK